MKLSVLKNLGLSAVLLTLMALLVVSTLVYQVSAVVLAERHELERWKDEIEVTWGYTDCRVMDDSTRVIRILTLQCRKDTSIYVHVAEGGTFLSESPVDAFDFNQVKAWAIQRYGEEASVSLTYYQGQTVLRIHSPLAEILIDPLTLSELWKVDLTYE